MRSGAYCVRRNFARSRGRPGYAPVPPSAEATDGGERPRKERKKDKAASPKKERRKGKHRDDNEPAEGESGPPPVEAVAAPAVQAGVGAGGGPRSSGVVLSSGARETGAKVVY